MHSAGNNLRKERDPLKAWTSNNVDDLEFLAKPLNEKLVLQPGEEFDPIPHPLLRKYVAYARKYIQPRLTTEASAILQEFYLTLRKKYRSKSMNFFLFLEVLILYQLQQDN